MKYYKLKQDYENYASFEQDYDNNEISFYLKYEDWKPINMATYIPYRFILSKSDTGKMNYQFDISTGISELPIFSEKAIEVLRPILEKSGQILPILLPVKGRNFMGFIQATAM